MKVFYGCKQMLKRVMRQRFLNLLLNLLIFSIGFLCFSCTEKITVPDMSVVVQTDKPLAVFKPSKKRVPKELICRKHPNPTLEAEKYNWRKVVGVLSKDPVVYNDQLYKKYDTVLKKSIYLDSAEAKEQMKNLSTQRERILKARYFTDLSRDYVESSSSPIMDLNIKEYSMKNKSFEIWVKAHAFYQESPPKRRHVFNGVAFPTLKISAEDVCRGFTCWGMQVFYLKVDPKSALPIEENREGLAASIYFNLTKDKIHTVYKDSAYSDEPSLEYNIPVARDLEIHFWKHSKKKTVTVLKCE